VGALRAESGHDPRDPQDHALLIGDEHMVGLRTLGIRGEQEKAAPEERMGRVSDFDLDPFLLCEGGWVIEWGIKVIDRSTTLTIHGCWTCCDCASMTGPFSA
jgi:hypothetical protein